MATTKASLKAAVRIGNSGDAKAIAKYCRSVEDKQYQPDDEWENIILSGDMSRNVSRNVTDSLDDAIDGAPTMTTLADAFMVALRDWCKANRVKARLAEMVSAVAGCPMDEKEGHLSWEALGEILGVTRQRAENRYNETFIKYLPDIRRIAQSVGFVA